MRTARLIILLFVIIVGENQAEAGPVIIDGTDANEHGEFSDGRNKEGWLYMQKALEALSIQLSPKVRRVVVVLGTFRDTQARNAIASAFKYSSLKKEGPDKWDIEYIERSQAIDHVFAQYIHRERGYPLYTNLQRDAWRPDQRRDDSHQYLRA